LLLPINIVFIPFAKRIITYPGTAAEFSFMAVKTKKLYTVAAGAVLKPPKKYLICYYRIKQRLSQMWELFLCSCYNRSSRYRIGSNIIRLIAAFCAKHTPIDHNGALKVGVFPVVIAV